MIISSSFVKTPKVIKRKEKKKKIIHHTKKEQTIQQLIIMGNRSYKKIMGNTFLYWLNGSYLHCRDDIFFNSYLEYYKNTIPIPRFKWERMPLN